MTISIDEIIGPAKWHRSIDGLKLTQAREAMGLSQEEFGASCSWTRSYQCVLETQDKDRPIEVAEAIKAVLGG